MSESQYQIPNMAGQGEGGRAEDPELLTQAREQAELLALSSQEEAAPSQPELAYTPEMHWQLRRAEFEIDWYRQEALNSPASAPRTIGSRFLDLVGANKPTRPTMAGLIEAESLAGRHVFGASAPDRFWLNPQLETTPGIRDWYFTYTTGQTEQTLHYQTTDHGSYKIFNGHRFDFGPGEAARLAQAITSYRDTVTRDVYNRAPARHLQK